MGVIEPPNEQSLIPVLYCLPPLHGLGTVAHVRGGAVAQGAGCTQDEAPDQSKQPPGEKDKRQEQSGAGGCGVLLSGGPAQSRKHGEHKQLTSWPSG